MESLTTGWTCPCPPMRRRVTSGAPTNGSGAGRWPYRHTTAAPAAWRRRLPGPEGAGSGKCIHTFPQRPGDTYRRLSRCCIRFTRLILRQSPWQKTNREPPLCSKNVMQPTGAGTTGPHSAVYRKTHGNIWRNKTVSRNRPYRRLRRHSDQ